MRRNKEIPLTQSQVALVDAEDFKWLSKAKWYAQWAPCTQSFYAHRKGSQHQQLRMHNVIWIHHNGLIPEGFTVDHADRDTLNDRLSNLRLATRSQQKQNQRMYGNNTSGYRGVHLRKDHQAWVAYIGVNRERLHLGTFTDPIEAARAYDAAAMLHFGAEFAQLNFP